ncbi:MAG: TIGR02186 family protein [Proteobacteria bacterium]|nr:TIGR02186 family protein [Pseudomonadota bacterium]
MRRRLVIGLWALLAAAAASSGALAQRASLVADLSSHLIAIDSGFTGAEVLLYGAVDEPGDLIVVVRGPAERVVVRRKDRVAGVWMNRDSIAFDGVPAYYAVAATRPLAEIARPALLSLHQIGIDAVRLTPLADRPADEIETFRAALVRQRTRDGLYSGEPGKVSFLGERLFRTRLYFPANVPTGAYRAEVFLIRDGAVVSAETTPLFINKTGFQAEVAFIARTRPALYGLAAILMALAAGWAAAAVFRKA